MKHDPQTMQYPRLRADGLIDSLMCACVVVAIANEILEEVKEEMEYMSMHYQVQRVEEGEARRASSSSNLVR